MNFQRLILRAVAIFIFLFSIAGVQDAEAGEHHKKKRIIIHVPIHKKIEKHVHTIIKHHHHHHKPIIIKEEKVIHQEYHPIKEEHLHHHHHEEHHEEHHPEIEDSHRDHEEEIEEEHIHHHHNYDHKYRMDES